MLREDEHESFEHLLLPGACTLGTLFVWQQRAPSRMLTCRECNAAILCASSPHAGREHWTAEARYLVQYAVRRSLDASVLLGGIGSRVPADEEKHLRERPSPHARKCAKQARSHAPGAHRSGWKRLARARNARLTSSAPAVRSRPSTAYGSSLLMPPRRSPAGG